MPSRASVPPLLEPYLSTIPAKSLTLITSTLTASANWLSLRYVIAALQSEDEDSLSTSSISNVKRPLPRVVLVSWLRDAKWWKEMGRKVGIDQKRWTILDELTGGLSSSTPETNVTSLSSQSASLRELEDRVLLSIQQAKFGQNADGDVPVTLVLDGLDYLLASTGCRTGEMLDMLRELRMAAHSVAICVAADTPLVFTRTTPLEISHAALVTNLIHQAGLIMATRQLDTGVAKDVSGVVRITAGGEEWNQDDELSRAGADAEGIKPVEYLYYVSGDGGVRVFERGS